MPIAIVSSSGKDGGALRAFSFEESKREELIQICARNGYDLTINGIDILFAGKLRETQTPLMNPVQQPVAWRRS